MNHEPWRSISGLITFGAIKRVPLKRSPSAVATSSRNVKRVWPLKELAGLCLAIHFSPWLGRPVALGLLWSLSGTLHTAPLIRTGPC